MPLNNQQYELFEQVVAIPSAYSHEDPASDEVELQERLWEILSESEEIRKSKQFMEDEKRFNIIAQKGAPIEDAEYVLLVYVHVDTVKRKRGWDYNYKLVRRGEMLHGIGAYDMKAGVTLLADLLLNVKVPKGMTVVGAFCVGEERDSDGVAALMKWPHISRVNLTLSPEIGSMGNNPDDSMKESDNPKSIIVARPGNVKSHLVITTPDSHAFNIDKPDANDAWRALVNHLKHAFGERIEGKRVREHPDLGQEFFRIRHMQTLGAGGGEFESIASSAMSRNTVRIVPPTTVDEIRTWQQRELEKFMANEGWGQHDIGAEFTEFGTSYHPYVVRTDSPIVQFTLEAAKDFYGDAKFSAGQAVADGSLGHFELNKDIHLPQQHSISDPFPNSQVPPPPPRNYVPWLDIGPLGQGAHKNSERVYEESLVKLIDFYKKMVEQYLPDYLS